jgi:hypothetical protein
MEETLKVGHFDITENDPDFCHFVAGKVVKVFCSIPFMQVGGKWLNREAVNQSMLLLSMVRAQFNKLPTKFDVCARPGGKRIHQPDYAIFFNGDGPVLRSRIDGDNDDRLTTYSCVNLDCSVVAGRDADVCAFISDRLSLVPPVVPAPEVEIAFSPLTGQAVGNCKYKHDGGIEGNLAIQVKTNINAFKGGLQFRHNWAVRDRISLRLVFDDDGQLMTDETVQASEKRAVHSYVTRLAIEFIKPQLGSIYDTLSARPLNLSGVGESLALTPQIVAKRKLKSGTIYYDDKAKDVLKPGTAVAVILRGADRSIVYDDGEMHYTAVSPDGLLIRREVLPAEDEFMRRKVINAASRKLT